VCAELVIHSSDLRCWVVAVGHDRRPWRFDCSISSHGLVRAPGPSLAIDERGDSGAAAWGGRVASPDPPSTIVVGGPSGVRGWPGGCPRLVSIRHLAAKGPSWRQFLRAQAHCRVTATPSLVPVVAGAAGAVAVPIQTVPPRRTTSTPPASRQVRPVSHSSWQRS